ncbi:hypothetical protein [Ralstonia mojiangensis]|uniref:hypothetical protein n=1 Tax=Ralstonia mojiangensis TaxID=2953895 RepID=UPI002090BB06|nr:hypothetical protein [Ralstonia mojiangensis]MCO5414015.1 hypothetical protein [Ralstonia mojiangensis]
MRGPELRVLSIAAIATLFATSALAATTETAEEELASWYYVAQSLTYGGYETDGLSFYANCEDGRLHVAVSTSAQPGQNGTALRIQFASGPLRLTIPARLEVSDMEAYAVGDVKPRARFYALFHTGKPITVKVGGADTQPLQLLQLSARNADTGARQLEAVCPVARRTGQ